ncbi:urea ABC transporter permease subunit UrtC [Tumidithrix helvetica PCC 7403]|uniref:urea ABC transporter permease subunit UrtC n=1 Tax=Tumidithrix helvetica TaxID=3457545 RepID=UPI003C959360
MTAIEVQKKQGQIKRSLLIEAAIVIGIALLLIFVVPLLLVAIGQGFRVELLGRFLALAIVALGIDLIWGYTGMLSLGHGVFFGLGGYAFAMYLKLQIPPDATSKLPSFMPLYGVTELPWIWQPFNSFPFTILAIILIPAIVGALFGFLVFRNRIRGVYFSILTQATTIIFYNIFNGQQKLINGTNGLTDFQTIFGATVNAPETRRVFYILTIVFLALAYALCRWLTSGKFGRLLIAIRDDEPRVRFTGYDPTGFKVLVFAISAALAGIGGALYTPQTGIISPNNSMNIAFSIEMVIWVAVGGRASLSGAILGAVLVNFAKSILSEQFSEIWLFFQGAMFLLVVMVLPDGLVGWARTQGVQIVKTLFFGRKVVPYPSLEEDPEVQYERKNLGD